MKVKYYIENDKIYWDENSGHGMIGAPIKEFIEIMKCVRYHQGDIKYEIYLKIKNNYPEYTL